MDSGCYRKTQFVSNFLEYGAAGSSMVKIGDTHVVTAIAFEEIVFDASSSDSLPPTPLCTITLDFPFTHHHNRTPAYQQSVANETIRTANSYNSLSGSTSYLHKLANSMNLFSSCDYGFFELTSSATTTSTTTPPTLTTTTQRYKLNLSFSILNNDGNFMDACVLGLSQSISSCCFPNTTINLPVNFLPVSISCAIMKNTKGGDGKSQSAARFDPGLVEEAEAMEGGGGGVVRVVLPCYPKKDKDEIKEKGLDELVCIDCWGGGGVKLNVIRGVLAVGRRRVEEVERALNA